MEKNIYITVGIPGSGKSTFIKERVKHLGGKYISRDEIRFSLIKNDEDYFAQEDKVVRMFNREIRNAILDDVTKDIYIDATHLNEASREKLLRGIVRNNTKVYAFVFNTPLEFCLARNAKRTGRALVPEQVIRNMQARMTDPATDARKYDGIFYVFTQKGEKNDLVHF